jgi:glyoxylase-like metal-dependent hydrolase (beta-lactamase superfamily II)
MNIIPIPLFKDNYSYLIFNNKNVGYLIDPADPLVIHDFITKNYPQMKISHIFLTHKHWDHAGDINKLLKLISNFLKIRKRV